MRVEITVTARDAETWDVADGWPGADPSTRTMRRLPGRPWVAPAEGDADVDGAAAMARRIHERRELEPDDGVGLGRFLFEALIGDTWKPIVATAGPASGVVELALR